MEQYISKSALVAEIERMLETIKQDIKDKNLIEQNVKDRDLCTIYAAQLLVLRNLAKHLDTLEVKEVKEPTASDKGMAEEIIINLKRVEQDYHINLTSEMTWLRSIAQKGE